MAATKVERKKARCGLALDGFVWHRAKSLSVVLMQKCRAARMRATRLSCDFARHACVLVARRITSPADAITFPNDDADHLAAAALTRAAEGVI